MKAGEKIFLEAEYVEKANGGGHMVRLKYCKEAKENDGQIMNVDESVIVTDVSLITERLAE